MSFSQSWIAVQGLEPETALEMLGVEVSAVVGPDAIDWRRILAMGQFRKDWLVVLSGDDEDAFDGRLACLAELGPAVAFRVSESVMYSEARGYEDGVQVWRVVHDPEEEESLYALQVEGNPPPELDPIIRTARAEQDAEGGDEAEVDLMFDIPGRLSQAICGYMPGEGEPEGFRYSVLRPIGGTEEQSGAPEGHTGKPGFFARLFGRS